MDFWWGLLVYGGLVVFWAGAGPGRVSQKLTRDSVRHVGLRWFYDGQFFFSEGAKELQSFLEVWGHWWRSLEVSQVCGGLAGGTDGKCISCSASRRTNTPILSAVGLCASLLDSVICGSGPSGSPLISGLCF